MTHAEKAKEFLETYKTAFYRLMQEKEKVLKYRDQLLKSPTLSGMPHGTDLHDLSDYVAHLEGLIEESERIERAELSKMRKVKEAIESLCSPRDRTILSYKYIDFMTFTQIAAATDMTVNAVYIRHKKALERLKWEE